MSNGGMMVETRVPEGERTELLHGSAEMVALATELEVVDANSLELAGHYRRHAKDRLQRIEDKVGMRVKAVYDAWRSLKDMQGELERPWKAILSICGQLIGNYELKQRQERLRLEQEAASARQRAEADVARRHREQLEKAKAQAEIDRMEASAALFEAGDFDGAQEALDQPLRPETVLIPVPTILPPTETEPPQRASGTSVAVVYKARLLDLDQLIEAAAADKSLRCLLQFNQTAGNGMAKAMGERMKVPGVEVFAAPSVRQR